MNLTHRPLHHQTSSALKASTSTSAATAAVTSTSTSTAAEVYNAAQGLLYVGFNQDASCFGVGTVAGFRVYNTDPLHERARREHVAFLSANPTFSSTASSSPASSSPLMEAGRVKREGQRRVPALNVPKSGGDRSKPPRAPASTSPRAVPSQDDEEWKRRRRRAGKAVAASPPSSGNVKFFSDDGPKALSSTSFDDLRDIESEDEFAPSRGGGSLKDDDGFDHDYNVQVDDEETPVGDLVFEKSPSASPPLIVEVEDDSDDFGFEMEADDDPTSPYAGGLSSSPPLPSFGSSPSGRRASRPLSPTSTGSDDMMTGASLPPRPELDRPGGIAIVEMLYRSNYVALVGGGRNPKFPANRVVIWDDAKGRVIMQLQFKSEVKAVKLRMDRMIIVFWNRVVVYTFSPRPRRLHTFETMRNDRGLVSLSPSPLAGVGGRPNTAVLAFLGRMVGQVQICELQLGPIADPIPGAASRNPSTTTPSKATSSSSSPPHPSNTRNSPLVIAPPSPLPNPPISIIAAHTSGLSCFTVSHSGHLIATASETGTLIRVFETRSGRLINELRRGLDRAEIFCIAFNLEGTRLCVSSDKGTIHVFNVTGAQHSSPAHQPMQNTDPAVGASMVAAQMAYPLGGSTPGGMVIDGLGGNSIPTSPSMTGSPPYASGRPAAASPSMRPGNVPPLSPYAQSASPIPTSSSTRSSSNLPRGASPSIQASSPSTTSSSSSTFTSGLTNRLSTLSFFSPLSKYFSSEWSFAQFSLPVEAKCICAFAASDRADDGPASAARRAVDAVRAGPGNLAPAPPPPPPTKALYFDFKTGTATSTLPGTSAPPAPTTWSSGPVTHANSIICLCADGSFYKFCFDAPPGAPGHLAAGGSGSLAARDGVLEGFVRFYRGVGVEPDGVGVADPEIGGGRRGGKGVETSPEGFVVSAAWGPGMEEDDG